ncbi:MAG: hypothetical protein ACOX4Q_14370 [Syntrophomonadales bacterium]
MSKFYKSLESLLALDVIKMMIQANNIEINRLNAAIAVLIKKRIPFDLAFTPGQRRLAASAVLTIYINPTTTINFTLQFEEGTLPG